MLIALQIREQILMISILRLDIIKKIMMFELKNQHSHSQFDCHPRNQKQEQVPEAPQQIQQPKQKVRKIRIKSLPGQDPNQYLIADSLIPQLQTSISLIEPILFEVISTRRKNLQLHVYTSLVEDGKDYLARLFKTDNKNQIYVHEMVSQTVENVHDLIVQEILDGEHEVHRIARPTKEDIYGGSRATEAAIRIRQSMLKAKLTDLKSDINNSSLHISSNPSSFLNLNSADLYTQSSYKTKQAKQFVKRMQELQQQQKRQRQLKQQFKRQKKLQEQSERRQMQERMKQEKHEFLKKQFERKRQQKQKQKKQEQQKNQQFQNFLKQFKGKVPLYKQKQKEYFQKFVIPENNKKLQILKQIKQDRKPLDHQQLKQHAKQYHQIKQDHVYQKNASRAVEEKTKKPQKVYFKGKFHSFIEKQEKQKLEVVDQSEIKTQMYTKRLEYGNQIKTKFVPKIDIKKKEEMEKNLQQLKWLEKVRINRSLNAEAYKKDGKDNLDKLHKYINQLKAKGKIRSSTSRTIETSPQTNSQRYKNYLHQLRQLGSSTNMKTSRSHSIDYGTIFNSSQDTQRFKINLRKKQESVLRKQQYVANLGSRNLQKFLEEKKKLDDDYLETVKAKMAIINQFKQ